MCHGHLHSFGMPYHMQFKFVSNNLVAHTYTRLLNAGRRCTATRTRTRACTRVQTRVHTNTYARTHTHTRTHTHRRVQPHFENMGDVLSGTRNIFVTNYRFVTNCTWYLWHELYMHLSRTMFVTITWHTDACNPNWETRCCAWPASLTHNKMYIFSSWQIYSAWQICYVSCSWQIRYVCYLWPLSSDTQQICHVLQGCHELDLYFFLDTYFRRRAFHSCVTS